MTTLERLRGDDTPTDLAHDAAGRARGTLDAVGRALDSVTHGIGDALGAVARTAGDATDAAGHTAGDAAGAVTRSVGDAAGAVTGSVGEAAGAVTHAVSEVADSVTGAVGGVASRAAAVVRPAEPTLGRRVEEIVERLRRDVPTERLAAVVAGLERQLPGTDTGRYDRAYQRGWARARSSFIGIGLVVGVLGGVAGAFFLDPARGRKRREDAAGALRRATTSVTRAIGARSGPGRDATTTDATRPGIPTPPPAPLVPVMDPAVAGLATGGALATTPVSSPTAGVTTPGGEDASSGTSSEATGDRTSPNGAGGILLGETLGGAVRDGDADPEPVMPVGSGVVTDASSIVREPLDTPSGGLIGGVATTVTMDPASPEPAADQAAAIEDASDGRLPVSSSAVTSSLEPQAEDATITGDEGERRTWHRNL